MTVKTFVAAALVGGLALMTSPSQVLAETTGTQRFTVLIPADGPGTVIATGVVTGVGSEVDTREQVPPGSPFQATYTFREGQLFATVAAAGRPQVEFNPRSCVTTITLVDTATITGGTGAFEGASGSSTDTVRVTSVAGRGDDGRCLGPEHPPIFELGIIRSEGTLTLP